METLSPQPWRSRLAAAAGSSPAVPNGEYSAVSDPVSTGSAMPVGAMPGASLKIEAHSPYSTSDPVGTSNTQLTEPEAALPPPITA